MSVTGEQGQPVCRDPDHSTAVWRRALRHVGTPVLLYEPASGRVIDASPEARELFRLSDDEAVRLDGLFAAEASPSPRDMLAAGLVDFVQGRLRCTRPGRGPSHTWYWARAIHSSTGANLGLLGIQAVDAGDGSTVLLELPRAQVIEAVSPAGNVVATVRLDEHWQVAEGTARSSGVGRRRPSIRLDEYVFDLVQPESRPGMLCSLALATTGARVGVWVDSARSRGPLVAMVSLGRESGDASYVIDFYDAPGADSDDRRVNDDERLADLPSRQLEIVTRLVRGDRVPAIARQLYLAPSTVRNHLTEVFRKFGVHSQAELIAVLRESDQ